MSQILSSWAEDGHQGRRNDQKRGIWDLETKEEKEKSYELVSLIANW
jgi:hypothetical protein